MGSVIGIFKINSIQILCRKCIQSLQSFIYIVLNYPAFLIFRSLLIPWGVSILSICGGLNYPPDDSYCLFVVFHQMVRVFK